MAISAGRYLSIGVVGGVMPNAVLKKFRAFEAVEVVYLFVTLRSLEMRLGLTGFGDSSLVEATRCDLKLVGIWEEAIEGRE